ncbi:DUF4126 domain-containing protein [Pannus brasiliensis CCIBt3594]|uniref:DUF4126 domain-containing protein n=1 Tax=Pannus brasiliensis CCIBt3594 TaxID=1427578 RepID=A0AAW9QHU6_9CHRO
MLTGLLAVLSAAAAAGLRVALPLLVIGLIRTEFWENIPFLSRFNPRVLLTILIVWSLFELFASKNLLGQRVLQVFSLIGSPIVGALISVAVAKAIGPSELPLWLLALLGGLLALTIKLVQIGWFFRLRGLPLWVTAIEDLLCIGLVFFAFRAPQQGGLIALFLLWLVIRSSTAWRKWYLRGRSK